MTRRFPRACALVGLVILATSLVGSTPEAHAADKAICTFNPDNGRLSPGMTATPSNGRWSAGPTPFDCHGTVNGQPVTGPGTIVESGPWEGTCSHGSGSGVQTITIPTAKGTIHLEIPVTFSWTGAAGYGSGPGMISIFEATATEGDCITTPMTGYRQFTQEFLNNVPQAPTEGRQRPGVATGMSMTTPVLQGRGPPLYAAVAAARETAAGRRGHEDTRTGRRLPQSDLLSAVDSPRGFSVEDGGGDRGIDRRDR
jgi:hypothetical protein